MKRSVIIDLIAIGLMILFLYTAISKLIDYQITRIQLADTPFIGPLAPVIAWAIPVLEIITVVLLFLPLSRLWGLFASFILMLLFTIYVVLLVSFSNTLPCSCGGVLEELSWKQHIIFNLFFTALSLWGIWLYRSMHTANNRANALVA